MKPVTLVMLLAVASACGGTTLAGSVAGSQMTINSSAAQAVNGEISFVLSSADDVCGDLTGNTGEAGTQNLAILIRNTTDDAGDSQPVGDGMYTVGPTTGMFASGQFEAFSDDCSAPVTAQMTGGTIILTSVDDSTGSAAGSLQIEFNGDTLSGNFSADACGAFSGLRCPIAPQ